ncbi:MAG: flagellar hook-associated protein FlgL [bacterium]|nr:flagellar hook-associated protein FlgL [bacterium]
MRVTQNTLFDRGLYELQRRFNEFAELQTGGATGKRIDSVDDDPAASSELVTLASEQKSSDQYLRNISAAKNQLAATEQALSRFDELFSSARAKAVAGGNGALTDAERAALADDVDQLLREMVSVGNRQADGRYLFGGARGNTQPFTAGTNADTSITSVSADWIAINTPVLRDIGPGEAIPTAITGSTFQISGSSGVNDIFSAVIQLRDNLRNGTATDVTDALPNLDLAKANISAARADVGEWVNRLTSAADYWGTRSLQTTTRISEVQDWDAAALMLKYKQTESAYQTALSITPSLLNLSLINFIG